MKDHRGPWYLLTGLVAGLVIGTLYAWVIRPVDYGNTSPASLRSDFKDRYRAMIASAYAANDNLLRANARLELLEDDDMYYVLAEQAQRTLADGNSPDEARALGLLALAIGQENEMVQVPGPGMAATRVIATPTGELQNTPLPASVASPTPAPTFTFTPDIPTQTETETSTPQPSPTRQIQVTSTATLSPPSHTPTPNPSPTYTPLPTGTPTATPGAPFVLKTRTRICDPDLGQSLIQILAMDAENQPVPGVEVQVTWEEGMQRFFTGLKPELGLGYADFTLSPGIIYSLRLADSEQAVTGLSAPECARPGEKSYWGGWRLTFGQ